MLDLKKVQDVKIKKLFWTFLLATMLMVLLLGCGKSETRPETTPGTVPTQEAIEEPDPIPEPISEPAPITDPEPEPILEPQPEPATAPAPAPAPTPTPAPAPAPAPTPTPAPGLDATAAQIIWGGTSISEGNQISLTFDAGWEYDNTLLLLDVLDHYQVKATFFLRGGWVEDHLDLAREIVNRGHAVGNHSQEHDHMNAMTMDEVTADITESTAIIRDVTGYAPDLFRPPYGEYNNRLLNMLGQQGYHYAVMWTIDSHDWAETMNGINVTENYLIDRVLTRATDNGIVLMHVGGYQTVNALPEIITGLRDAGYELVTLDEHIPR